MVVSLIYLSVQKVYYMTFQMSIVTIYLNCITHIVEVFMVANCGNLIVFRVSINFTLLGGKQSEGYGKLTLARITY